jgi:hypothetical protein
MAAALHQATARAELAERTLEGERERCAKIADERAQGWRDEFSHNRGSVALNCLSLAMSIAEAIRKPAPGEEGGEA